MQSSIHIGGFAFSLSIVYGLEIVLGIAGQPWCCRCTIFLLSGTLLR